MDRDKPSRSLGLARLRYGARLYLHVIARRGAESRDELRLIGPWYLTAGWRFETRCMKLVEATMVRRHGIISPRKVWSDRARGVAKPTHMPSVTSQSLCHVLLQWRTEHQTKET